MVFLLYENRTFPTAPIPNKGEGYDAVRVWELEGDGGEESLGKHLKTLHKM